MKRIALIRNNIVINIALWDGIQTWNPEEAQQLIDISEQLTVKMQSSYDPNTQQFTPPAESPSING